MPKLNIDKGKNNHHNEEYSKPDCVIFRMIEHSPPSVEYIAKQLITPTVKILNNNI